MTKTVTGGMIEVRINGIEVDETGRGLTAASCEALLGLIFEAQSGPSAADVLGMLAAKLESDAKSAAHFSRETAYGQIVKVATAVRTAQAKALAFRR
jgi:hypothetical protein